MSKHSFSYEFAGLRFSPETMRLEVLESGKKINLTPTHCRFISALAEKPREIVTYDQLRQGVWVNEKEMSESLKRLIQTTKGDLVKLLRRIEIKTAFIESVKGEGYRLDAEVTINENPANAQNAALQKNFSAKENEIPEKPSAKNKNRFFGKHAAFVLLVSLFYGLLYWIALLLEIAYQLDRFGAKSFWLGLPLVLWIGGTMFFGLRLAEDFVRQENRYGFLGGFAILFGGVIAACLAMWFFLPNEPITAAHFQSQPAFAAFVKNSLIYFLPLGVVFVLIPFHYVCAFENTTFSGAKNKVFSQKGIINLRFAHLFAVWLVSVMYAVLSTFYLLDNLLPAQFHGLFVVLAFLRFFVYFGLGLACLLWYKSTLNSAAQ